MLIVFVKVGVKLANRPVVLLDVMNCCFSFSSILWGTGLFIDHYKLSRYHIAGFISI